MPINLIILREISTMISPY